MSLKNTIILLVVAFFFAACAPKQLQPPMPVYVDPEDILFAQAEDLFQAKLYEKALIKYTEYLSRFPKERLADAALMKTGTIWSDLGYNAKALTCYNRLIADYPKSPFIPDAMVKTLVVLYNEGKYNEAIRQAKDVIKRFPGHENALKAQKLIEEIRKKAVYSKYTIGCLLPLSGPYESFGRRALKGIELAMNQFCSQGIQPAVKLIIKDTESDADKAVAAVKELFEEHVAAIIGPIFTAESAAIVAQDKGIPIITITQKNNIADIGDYVFRNFFTPMMQVHTLVSYVIEEMGLGSFAILYPEDNYGTTFMNLFWDEVTAYDGKVVGVESYNVEHTDFADPIKKLVGLYYKVPEDLKIMDMLIEDDEDDIVEDGEASKNDDMTEDGENGKQEQEPEAIVDFDAIFIPDAPERAGLIIPQLTFYDVKDVYLLGTNLWHCDSLIKMARSYAQNAIMPDVFFAESSSKQVADFVAVFEQTFKEKPEFIEAVSYDSAMILLQIVSRPDIRYRSSIKSALMNLNNFQGVTGLTSFDSNGEIKKRLYLLRIKGKKFIELNQN